MKNKLVIETFCLFPTFSFFHFYLKFRRQRRTMEGFCHEAPLNISLRKGQRWIMKNYPLLLQNDGETMRLLHFPKHARDYIRTYWIKIGDENGGTYRRR